MLVAWPVANKYLLFVAGPLQQAVVTCALLNLAQGALHLGQGATSSMAVAMDQHFGVRTKHIVLAPSTEGAGCWTFGPAPGAWCMARSASTMVHHQCVALWCMDLWSMVHGAMAPQGVTT